jgi:HTH-type transcriptional regulator/antitoxin HigA
MKRHYPLIQCFASTPPGATLADLLLERKLTHAEFCEQTKLSQTRLCRIICGDDAITSDLAELLESTLGPPASFWLNRERQYRQALNAIAEIPERCTNPVAIA